MDCDAPGYPRKRAAVGRVVMHLRHMLRQGLLENLGYLGSRLSCFHRHLTHKDEELFGDADIAATAAAQAIQHSADAMSRAWADYTPQAYAGALVLITAEMCDFRPSQIDDDPLLGWGPLIGQGITLQTMDAHHVKMIEPAHASELARILSDALEKQNERAPREAGDGVSMTSKVLIPA